MTPQSDFAGSLPHRHFARVCRRPDLRRTPRVRGVSLVDLDLRIEREIEKREK